MHTCGTWLLGAAMWTLCNSHPFTFYLPFHTSLRADQCPIQSHVPSTCTLGLDPCARHSLFGRTDPYYIDNFYSSCGLKRLAATLASPFSVIVLSSQYLFQRGPIWVYCNYSGSLNMYGGECYLTCIWWRILSQISFTHIHNVRSSIIAIGPRLCIPKHLLKL